MRRTATRNGEAIVLTSAEFDLLAALLRSAGRVVTREELARASLGREWRVSDRCIDVHASNLRKKPGHRENSERILTVRGVGYLYTLAPGAVNHYDQRALLYRRRFTSKPGNIFTPFR